MNVLLVEDDPERIEWFSEEFVRIPNLHRYITKDTHKAIRWLETGAPFDYIFLDHDLKMEHYTNEPYLVNETPLERWDRIHNKPGTGREVTRWLAANPAASPKAKIFIHSWNETGRCVMAHDVIARRPGAGGFGGQVFRAFIEQMLRAGGAHEVA